MSSTAVKEVKGLLERRSDQYTESATISNVLKLVTRILKNHYNNNHNSHHLSPTHTIFKLTSRIPESSSSMQPVYIGKINLIFTRIILYHFHTPPA